jgi:hypothetical protein
MDDFAFYGDCLLAWWSCCKDLIEFSRQGDCGLFFIDFFEQY